MLKQAIFTTVAAASALLVAAADQSQLAPAFKNTVVSTYPDGRTARLWLSSDGSYTAEGRRKDRSSGHWKVKGDKICLRQSHPATLPLSYCTALPSGGVGSTWSAKSVFGDPLKVTLVAGRS
jgi:hypothetical protein